MTLTTGDVLVAYTDGFSEAADPKGVQLGTEGVRGMIVAKCDGRRAPDEWPQALLESALAYRKTPVEDDTLILTMFRP